EDRRRLLRGKRKLPAFRRFNAICWPKYIEVRYRTQCGEMLDRLMRRSVFAEADRVMRHNVDDTLLHQRRKPDRWPAIVCENQKRAAVRNERTRESETVHRGRHAVRAYAVVHVVACEITRRDRRVMLRLRSVRTRQIRRSADELRKHRNQLLEGQ